MGWSLSIPLAFHCIATSLGNAEVKIKYKHTNIVARDWPKLVKFYQEALDCEPIPPERDLKGEWLDKGVGVANAHITGVHLVLPGYGPDGPTLEILHYSQNETRAATAPNREGIMHLAFEVEEPDLVGAVDRFLEYGGSKVGDLTSLEIPGAGTVAIVYLADPEGNIVELQSWKQ